MAVQTACAAFELRFEVSASDEVERLIETLHSAADKVTNCKNANTSAVRQLAHAIASLRHWFSEPPVAGRLKT